MPSNLELAAKVGEILPTGNWVAIMSDEGELGHRLDALRELAWPDLETTMVGPGGFTGTFQGIDGFREAWQDWLRPFQTYEVEIEDIKDAGGPSEAAGWLASSSPSIPHRRCAPSASSLNSPGHSRSTALHRRRGTIRA